MGHTSFTIEEVKILSDIIRSIYDPSLSLSEFTEVFMAKLKSLIYFDKSDFMFFRYNLDTKKYEMESFRPVNWSTEEINSYVTTYMHNDDVLPILSQREYIAFRNSDLFSMPERRETKYFQEFASGASLEISIDANIPLPEDYDTIAILGLFRTNEKVEFKEKDLEIIKCLQPYLSDRMKEEFCPGRKQAARKNSEKKQTGTVRKNPGDWITLKHWDYALMMLLPICSATTRPFPLLQKHIILPSKTAFLPARSLHAWKNC